MDHDNIRYRIASLRKELEKIGAEDREYYRTRDHTDIMKREHEDRLMRNIQIRAELLEMLNDDAA